MTAHSEHEPDRPAVPVFFLSDSTGISAETMGNALLIQFPDLRFDRRLIPFISTVEEARKVVDDPGRGHGRPGHPPGVLHHRGRPRSATSCTSRSAR